VRHSLRSIFETDQAFKLNSGQDKRTDLRAQTDVVNAMFLDEFLKERRKVDDFASSGGAN
jgi:hypothetical protein